MIDKTINYFLHSGHAGDIIYSLPTITTFSGKSILILKRKRRSNDYYDVLYRLLKLQPCLHDVRRLADWTEQDTPWLSFNHYKRLSRGDLSKHLVACHLEIFNKTYDLSKPWLENIKSQYIADIIITRTTRFHDKEEVDWTLLKPFVDKCKFVGHHYEHQEFIKLYNCDIEYYPTKDALDVAQVIKGSKLFIGNNSMNLAIAEGLRHPRCVELYRYHPCAGNCDPNNNDGYWTYLTEELIYKHILK